MVLLEAQSYGLPIVSYDCDTGPSEIITHGENGYLVRMGDISEMSFFLKSLMYSEKNSYISFSESAINSSKSFHVDNIINKWCKII